MDIVEIVPLDRRKSRVLTDDGTAFALYNGELRRYRIEEGGRLEPGACREIEEVLRRRARERALYLLKGRDYTEAELLRKLREGSYPADAIEKTMTFLKECGLIDDMAYGRRYVELYGCRRSRRWIENSLIRKGLNREQICCLLEQGEIEEEAQIRDCLRRKRYDADTCTPQDRRKIMASLVRKGYSYENVCRVMGAAEAWE